MVKKCDGCAEIIVICVMAACFAVGIYYKYKTTHIDAPAEQAVEAILNTQGIKVDFSAQKKHSAASDGNRATDNRSLVAVAVLPIP